MDQLGVELAHHRLAEQAGGGAAGAQVGVGPGENDGDQRGHPVEIVADPEVGLLHLGHEGGAGIVPGSQHLDHLAPLAAPGQHDGQGTGGDGRVGDLGVGGPGPAFGLLHVAAGRGHPLGIEHELVGPLHGVQLLFGEQVELAEPGVGVLVAAGVRHGGPGEEEERGGDQADEAEAGGAAADPVGGPGDAVADDRSDGDGRQVDPALLGEQHVVAQRAGNAVDAHQRRVGDEEKAAPERDIRVPAVGQGEHAQGQHDRQGHVGDGIRVDVADEVDEPRVELGIVGAQREQQPGEVDDDPLHRADRQHEGRMHFPVPDQLGGHIDDDKTQQEVSAERQPDRQRPGQPAPRHAVGEMPIGGQKDQGSRQGGGHLLGQQSQQIKDGRQPQLPGGGPRVGVADGRVEGEHRQQIEDGEKDIGGGGRLDRGEGVDGMQDEEQAGDSGGDELAAEAATDEKDQEPVQPVEDHLEQVVDHVIAAGELIGEPEIRVGDGPVVARVRRHPEGDRAGEVVGRPDLGQPRHLPIVAVQVGQVLGVAAQRHTQGPVVRGEGDQNEPQREQHVRRPAAQPVAGPERRSFGSRHVHSANPAATGAMRAEKFMGNRGRGGTEASAGRKDTARASRIPAGRRSG